MTSFNIEQKRVDVFASAAPDRPVIYLNTYGREGKQVFKHLQETGCPVFHWLQSATWNGITIWLPGTFRPYPKKTHPAPEDPMII